MKTRSSLLQALHMDRHDKANQLFLQKKVFSRRHQKAAVSWKGRGLGFRQLAPANP